MAKKFKTITQLLFDINVSAWWIALFLAAWLTMLQLDYIGWEFYIGLAFLILAFILGCFSFWASTKDATRKTKSGVILIFTITFCFFVSISFFVRLDLIMKNSMDNISFEIQPSSSTDDPFNSLLIVSNNGRSSISWHQIRWINIGTGFALSGGGGTFKTPNIPTYNDVDLVNTDSPIFPQEGIEIQLDSEKLGFSNELKGKPMKIVNVDIVVLMAYKISGVPIFSVRKAKRFKGNLENGTYKWIPMPLNFKEETKENK